MYDWKRLKNYGLWVSIFALVPLVLEGFNVNILPKNYSEIVTTVLSILVMAGILNNPTTKSKGFSDDKLEARTLDEISENNIIKESKNKQI